MAQKNASPTREQARVLEKNGLDKYQWVVIQEFSKTMIIKHRVTGAVKHIDK